MTESSLDVFSVAHLTTVDLSLRFLVKPQLLAVLEDGGEAIGISAPGPWVPELEEAGIRHVALTASTRGFSVWSDFRAAAQLWRVLKTENLTVLHTHNPKPGLYGRVLGRLAGVPLVVNTMHGFYATEDDPPAKRLFVYMLEAIAARFSDVELHQNPEDLELAKKLRILPAGKGSLLGNGVDLTRFDARRVDPTIRARIRKELGVDDSQLLVGAVGRLVAEKGYPELFEAMSLLDDRFRLVAVGPDDPDKADALPREMVSRAEASGVSFLGMRTDVDELYTAMDIFVLPSHREGFPRAAMEAAATGLPIVATNIRGCRQVVDQEVNGALVPVSDPEALARAIGRIGDDPELRNRMADASRVIAVERFDERRVVATVMDSYRSGLAAKGLGHLMPAGQGSVDSIRDAGPQDAAALAGLHASEIATGFLPTLGPRFMRVLYRAMTRSPGAFVIVAEQNDVPVGFVAAVSDVGEFYREFIRSHGLRAFWAALPRLWRPAVVRKAWESLRYGSGEETTEIRAELLSMAVAPHARGRGLSTSLGERLKVEMLEADLDSMRVVVASDNATAIGAYRRLGFAEEDRIEVHAGETSEVMVWRA